MFPEVDVFFDLPGSILIVASRELIVGRPRMPEERFRGERMAADLAGLAIQSPEAVLSRWVAGRSSLLEVAGEGPINRWDTMPLEFSAYRSTLANLEFSIAKNLRLLIAAQTWGSLHGNGGLLPAEAPSVRSSLLLREAQLRNLTRDLSGAIELAQRALHTNPGDAAAASALKDFKRSAGSAQRP